MRVALHACIRASAFYPRQRLQIISCSCWHTSDSWSQISHLKWLGSGNHEKLWVTFLTMHRYVTHHKSWLYRAKSLRKWVIVLSLVWGIILSLDFLVERKYSSGQWSYLRWVLWATSEVNVKISFLSSFRCNVAHPTFLYCVFTLIAARSFFFFFKEMSDFFLLTNLISLSNRVQKPRCHLGHTASARVVILGCCSTLRCTYVVYMGGLNSLVL